MSEEFTDQVAAFEKKLEELVNQRAEIDRQIRHYRQVIESLSAIEGVTTDPALSALLERQAVGLTSSIEQILNVEPRVWKTSADMRRWLLFYGVSLSKYANASAVIKTVLERLVKKGIAERDPKSDVARYRYNMRPLEEKIEKAIRDSKKKG